MAPGQGYGSIAITSESDDQLVEKGGHASAVVQSVKTHSRWWIIAGVGVLSFLVYSVVPKTGDSTNQRFRPDAVKIKKANVETTTGDDAYGSDMPPVVVLGDDDSYDPVASEDDAIDPSATMLYFEDQLADHFSDSEVTWPHRYYTSDKYWGGPGNGNPIFMIMGGEGAVQNILYPFVSEVLAKEFNGFVLQTEHRFYGTSQPTNKPKSESTNKELRHMLSPEQAMADFVMLLRHVQDELKCSTDRKSPEYCPVITVGASYPGFLAAMMRYVYPDVVDFAYASSSPLPLYAQQLDENAYFEKITQVAEESSPGCAAAVKETLVDMQAILEEANDYKKVAHNMGICVDTLPRYITDIKIFRNAVSMIAGTSFADFNMAYYPPSESSDLVVACKIFQRKSQTSLEKMKAFYQLKDDSEWNCFDLRTEMPEGKNSTVSSADWSGVGAGNTGRMWDFQTCRDLVVRAGFSNKTMFIPREWTIEWLTEHCHERFGVTPQPYHMLDIWGFDDLVGNGGSHIIFTNGLNDGWAVASHLTDLSDTIVAINFPNGAHHSDLGHEWPLNDTKDVEEGHAKIVKILGEWLDDLYGPSP
jgi:pimeloyl-ACP methyl ester carboxylesterase